jgi:carbonic anhydrase/acetyltransferase-like protein (isoleucine patch superfamily)
MAKSMLRKLTNFKSYFMYARLLWHRYVSKYVLMLAGVKVGKRVKLLGMPIVTVQKESLITLGDDCVLCSLSNMTDLGVNHPVILRTLRSVASITIGDHTGISGGSFCAASKIKIGKNCLLGANVTITDSDFHPIKPEGRRYNVNPEDIFTSPVIVEDNVFIGSGAYILKGVTIGENSVVGAGSIVTKDVPRNSIVAGNPAKLIRMID